ncbi:hypothetical protein CWR43_12160 [Rhizobium sullae]|uniref:Uncharacterized protein n=1 Tax=Rhizobium sullae TaxID=50338 RepID=A0A2N0DC74_RHISU|nr:DUF1796 family putative cysteine peptidase [Rhizobium sullae]PKA43686.1 hypothetical protein CWR43_12160 [Rhizobium sullae]
MDVQTSRGNIMGHQYISLGAACNAAMMIKKLGLRKTSYPFDWLLNLDSGLASVTEMIKDDFQKVCAPDCYMPASHSTIATEVVAYRDYPTVLHIHTNPMSKTGEHDELVRRFDRFRRTLRSRDKLHFVYYRNLAAARLTDPSATAQQVLRQLIDEASVFLDTISAWRGGDTSLLLVLESGIEDIEPALIALASVTVPDRRIQFGHAISRYDENPVFNDIWKRQWTDLLLNRTEMPLHLTARALANVYFRRLKSFINGDRLPPISSPSPLTH